MLTITVRGTFNLNQAAFELLGKPDAVVLLYARDERTIGLRPAGRDDPDAYLVRPSGTAKSPTMMAVVREFCRWIGADLSESRRYPLTLGDGGLGCVSLNDRSQVVTGNRARGAVTSSPSRV